MRTWLLRVKFWIPKYLHMNLQVVELTAPSASLQMTPSWVVQMIQQKNRWHPEEPLGLERWVYTNLRKFKKAKCKVMQPGWGNSKCQYRLGGWVDWEPQSRDGLGGVGWWKKKKSSISQQHKLAAQKTNHILGCMKKKCGQQAEGGNSLALLSPCKTPHTALHSAVGPWA